jgi:hypothetical protein
MSHELLKAARHAKEVLHYVDCFLTMNDTVRYELVKDAIADLEKALAQPEQEPNKEWVGLTDGEIQYILDCGRGEFIAIQKAQQLLKDKNTTNQ